MWLQPSSDGLFFEEFLFFSCRHDNSTLFTKLTLFQMDDVFGCTVKEVVNQTQVDRAVIGGGPPMPAI